MALKQVSSLLFSCGTDSHMATDVVLQHLPDIKNFDGILDLLSLCILVILGNVLDFQTYSAPNQHQTESATQVQRSLMNRFDRNDIQVDERMAMCHGRGVAIFLLKWVRSCCLVTGPDGVAVEDLPSLYLVKVLKALLSYKRMAQKKRINGTPHCTLSLLERQIQNVVQCDPSFETQWRNRANLPDDSLNFGKKDGYKVEWKTGWEDDWFRLASGR